MTTPAFDPDALAQLERLAGAALVRKVLETLHGELPARLDTADAAAAAGDGAALIRAVHGLLSVSSYAGEHALRLAALEVEKAARAGTWDGMPTRLAALRTAAADTAPRVAAALRARTTG
jgi:HPt (histidine-containing phosphotransfer) domain-containing protein